MLTVRNSGGRYIRENESKRIDVYCAHAEDFVRLRKCKGPKHEYCRDLQRGSLMKRDLDDRKSKTKVTRSGPVSPLARTGDRKHKVTQHLIPKRGPSGRFRKGSGWHTDRNNKEAMHI